MQISELNPKKVFFYFSELSKIPHGSGNTEQIASYCIEFAKKRGLKSYRDSYGNVMLFKDGTAGYEESEPVIIQGHLDMVCEKEQGCTKNMETEGISLATDGEYLWAEGTTLGGDDGIAVAYALALLDSDDIPHPPLEAVFTVDEEVGLRGARALDASHLKGKRLINIDSEEEGILTVSCAGGVRAVFEIPLMREETAGDKCGAREITVSGLLGGHSGVDIDKCRKNAAKVLATLLYELNSRVGIRISDMSAGGRLNVIPNFARAVVCFEKEHGEKIDEIVSSLEKEIRADCVSSEPNICVTCKEVSNVNTCASSADTDKIIFALMQMIDGVYEMSPDIASLVRTSSNIGSVDTENERLVIGMMIRSNTAAGKSAVVRNIKSLAEYIGAELCLDDDYPAWEYRANSPLRAIMEKAYEDMYGNKPQICAIHAGLECGIISEKLKDADMVSIGPTMENVHTSSERLSVDSVKRVWEYLLHVLEMLK